MTTVTNTMREELFKADKTFRYQLLGRMQQDCDYWLGYGGRNDKKLWALEKNEHLKLMGELLESFSPEEKPTWLTPEQLAEYVYRMSDEHYNSFDSLVETLEKNGKVSFLSKIGKSVLIIKEADLYIFKLAEPSDTKQILATKFVRFEESEFTREVFCDYLVILFSEFASKSANYDSGQ